MFPTMLQRVGPVRALAVVLLVCCASCSSLSISRETQTSGRFKSSGWALTILSIDIPKQALDIARENASDSRLTNMQVETARVIPYLGWFDWLLDIISIRYARVEGTWGFDGESGE